MKTFKVWDLRVTGDAPGVKHIHLLKLNLWTREGAKNPRNSWSGCFNVASILFLIQCFGDFFWYSLWDPMNFELVFCDSPRRRILVFTDITVNSFSCMYVISCSRDGGADITVYSVCGQHIKYIYIYIYNIWYIIHYMYNI